MGREKSLCGIALHCLALKWIRSRRSRRRKYEQVVPSIACLTALASQVTIAKLIRRWIGNSVARGQLSIASGPLVCDEHRWT